jgi:hypothetical protein
VVIGVKNLSQKLGNKPILGDRYTSKEFMALEWEKLWTKVWQVAGLEQQLKILEISLLLNLVLSLFFVLKAKIKNKMFL